MARYKLTTQDRSKGGKATAAKQAPAGFKSYMQYLGKRGLQGLADKYFHGNIKKAGDALWRMGAVSSDPTKNRAWRRIMEMPPELLSVFWGHCEPDDSDGVPF